MCFFFTILFLGPRFGLLLYWIAWPARWEAAFDGFFIPLIGFLLFPWLTLTWVLCAPGGIEGFDVVLVIMAGFVDVISLAGGGGSYRQRSTAMAGSGAP